MKVLNLQCAQCHSFEGRFESKNDFQSQFARSRVECPLCAYNAVVKMPSAPRLNFGGHVPLSTVFEQGEDVVDRFADQARAMHYGDTEPLSIRGQATPREAAKLMEEGIDVMAILKPAVLKETLQ